MIIQRTGFTRCELDTCKCVIEADYVHDIELDEEAGTATLIGVQSEWSRLVNVCEFHTNSTMEEVKAEHFTKNLEVSGPLMDAFAVDGFLPKGKSLEWERNPKGELEYKIIGFTKKEKAVAVSVITKGEVLVKDEAGEVIKQPVVKDPGGEIKDI